MNITFDEAFKAYAGGAVFIAFDLETTGLDPRQDKIAEIGAVKFDKLGLIARFSTLINPGIPMPAEAERVNKISDEMLRDKPSLDEVLPDFLRFINGAIIVAHNAPFDCGFINAKLGEFHGESLTRSNSEGPMGFTSLPNPIADTLTFSREIFPALRSHSLQNLAAELGITVQSAHRAEDDALLCIEIFLRCAKSLT